jgi:hypothetical protein
VKQTGTLILLAAWLVWVLMLLWVQASVKDMKPFDPFEILGLERDANDKEIKKAYRQLSLKYHPDKVCRTDPLDNFIFIHLAGLMIGLGNRPGRWAARRRLEWGKELEVPWVVLGQA